MTYSPENPPEPFATVFCTAIALDTMVHIMPYLPDTPAAQTMLKRGLLHSTRQEAITRATRIIATKAMYDCLQELSVGLLQLHDVEFAQAAIKRIRHVLALADCQGDQ
jgi:hypothetical protein